VGGQGTSGGGGQGVGHKLKEVWHDIKEITPGTQVTWQAWPLLSAQEESGLAVVGGCSAGNLVGGQCLSLLGTGAGSEPQCDSLTA